MVMVVSVDVLMLMEHHLESFLSMVLAHRRYHHLEVIVLKLYKRNPGSPSANLSDYSTVTIVNLVDLKRTSLKLSSMQSKMCLPNMRKTRKNHHHSIRMDVIFNLEMHSLAIVITAQEAVAPVLVIHPE